MSNLTKSMSLEEWVQVFFDEALELVAKRLKTKLSISKLNNGVFYTFYPLQMVGTSYSLEITFSKVISYVFVEYQEKLESPDDEGEYILFKGSRSIDDLLKYDVKGLALFLLNKIEKGV